MDCDEARKLVDAYADAELDPITSARVEQHLRTCAACTQLYEAQRSLARGIQGAAPYYRASSGLRERIRASLRESIDGDGATDVPRRLANAEPRRRYSAKPANWLAIAAAVALTAVVAVSLSSRLRPGGGNDFLATQLIASHVRSLMATHLTDVASSDHHTVKPWLDEKLDFAAPVTDLAGEGFPLVGGRLDYLNNRTVAALVYQRRKHYINLFVWPGDAHESSPAADTVERQGYHLLHWTDSDFTYWAVSDVNADDLRTFKESFQKQLRR